MFNLRKNGFVLMILLLAALLVESLYGISVRPLQLAEMGSLSDRVFLGRVVGVDSAFDRTLGLDVTTYTFMVLEAIKGPGNGETVRIRQAGKPGGNAPIPGLPGYRKGQEILLFLHPDSRLGLTSPVGMIQGVFSEIELPDGERGYCNGIGNRNLVRSGGDQLRAKDSSSFEALPITITEIREAIGGSAAGREIPE